MTKAWFYSETVKIALVFHDIFVAQFKSRSGGSATNKIAQIDLTNDDVPNEQIPEVPTIQKGKKHIPSPEKITNKPSKPEMFYMGSDDGKSRSPIREKIGPRHKKKLL